MQKKLLKNVVKYYVSLVVLLMLVGGNSFVVLANTSATSSEEGRRTGVENAQTEIRKGLGETVREKLKEGAAKRIRDRVARITERLSNSTSRLLDISSRLSSRLDKIDAGRGTTTEARVLLGEARIKLNNAKTDTQSIKDTVITITTGDKPREAIQNLKDLVEQVQKDLKEARQDLIKAVRSLKTLGKNSNGDETTTATSSSTN